MMGTCGQGRVLRGDTTREPRLLLGLLLGVLVAAPSMQVAWCFTHSPCVGSSRG